MKKEELTQTQMEIMDYIRSYMDANSMPPTRKEISDYIGFSSPNAVQDHLTRMEAKGHVEIIPNIARGIRLL